MPSHPVQRACVAAVQKRAVHLLGPGATGLQYLLAMVERGVTIEAIADAIGEDIRRPVTRGWFYRVIRKFESRKGEFVELRCQIKARQHGGAHLAALRARIPDGPKPIDALRVKEYHPPELAAVTAA
jgi:hypothetical protein